MDYGRPLEFGISIVPEAGLLAQSRALVQAADANGLDLVGIQDHPYQRRFLDTWMLMASLLAETEHIRGIGAVALRGLALYYGTEEAAEGKNAFLEKRKPSFARFRT